MPKISKNNWAYAKLLENFVLAAQTVRTCEIGLSAIFFHLLDVFCGISPLLVKLNTSANELEYQFPVAQRITRSATNREIAGSNPVWDDLLLFNHSISPILYIIIHK